MKHNRILLLFLVLLLTLSLSGCVSGPDISEEQSDLVAEYAAGVLLRYSNRYERRLITKEQVEKENQKKNAESTAQPEATATPTAEPSQTVPSVSDGSEGEPQVTETPAVPLNDIYHIDGLEFSYQSYRFCQKYNEQIQAGKGEILFVADFKVKNLSGKKQKVNLGKRNISYKLMVDDSEYLPTISILDNMGLNYLDTVIPSGETEDAVLIYRMSEERKQAQTIALSVEDGNAQSVIKMK